jgi:hypothetical protein
MLFFSSFFFQDFGFSCVSTHEREKEKEGKKNICSIKCHSPISALLVGRSVITEVPFDTSNTNNTYMKEKTQSQKKFAAFNIKQQIKVFL